MTSLVGVLATGTWVVDTAASSAQFTARDVLRKQVEGTLPVVTAAVEVSADGVPLSVRAELDLAGVETGSARRDGDLRGHRFFDVARSPVLHFSAGPARADGPARWLLAGELVLGEARCAVQVTVDRQRDDADDRARVRATLELDRHALGITVPRLLVGRVVSVVVDAVLLAPPTAADA